MIKIKLETPCGLCSIHADMMTVHIYTRPGLHLYVNGKSYTHILI